MLDGLPRSGRPLHGRARRGDLPPLRRAQARARARADLRALRRSDLARAGAIGDLGGDRDGDAAHARALALRLRGLPRDAHARAEEERLASSRPGWRQRSTASGSPSGCSGRDRELPRSRAREPARAGPLRSGRTSELNPVLLEAARALARGRARARRESAVELYRRFGFPLDDAGGAVHARFSAETEELYERALERLLELRLGLRLDAGRPLGHAPALPRYPLGLGLPGRPDAPGAQGHARRSRHRPAQSQENVELDIEPRPSKTPARLLRADRGTEPRSCS